MIASCLAHEDSNVSPDAWSTICKPITLLCHDVDVANLAAEHWYRNPPGFDNTVEVIGTILDHHSLRRLHLAAEMVLFDLQADCAKSPVFNALREHAARHTLSL
jgi:hypothetical protein